MRATSPPSSRYNRNTQVAPSIGLILLYYTLPLLKFEDRDYDQGQDDDGGGRVGGDFEEADVDPKVE